MISKQNLSISQHSYVAKRSLINTRGDRKPGGCEWIEHSLSPLLTNFLVSVSGFRVGKMSAVKGMGGPGTTMGGRGPDDDRPRECINRRHQGPPDVHSSGVVQVVSTALSENVEHQGTSVSSILSTLSATPAASRSGGPVTSNHWVGLSSMWWSCRVQSDAWTLFTLDWG